MTTAKQPTTLSLIVNTTDRSGPLSTLLRSLEHQSYPHFEVIVVVGPTRDDTMEMLAGYGDRVNVLRCAEANLSRSRNIGLRAARGDVVVYTDDDAVPCRRWLEQIATLFEDPHLDATGGVVHLIHPRSPTVQHRIGITTSLAEQVNVRTSLVEAIPPPGKGRQWTPRMMGANMAFRREALLAVGGFDEFYIYIAEETDLALRMANAGFLTHPVLEAPIYHVPASSHNRVVFTNTGRWWLGTRSESYFAIKNGPAAGDSRGDILRHILYRVHGQWLWYGRLRRSGQMGMLQTIRKSGEEIWGAVVGSYHGLLSERQLLDGEESDEVDGENVDAPIRPYLRADSPRQPVVDPVSGRHPTIEMRDEPLRVCLTSGLYPPEHYDGIGRHTNLIARGLFELGHTVHVITRSEQEQIRFYEGAYVHSIPYTLDRYPRYRHLSSLHHTLNYSHAIQEYVARLELNDGVQLVDSPLWQVEGLVTAMSRRLPVIVRLQTTMRQVSDIQSDLNEDRRLLGEMEQGFLDRAEHIVPNSRATLETIRRLYELQDGIGHTTVPHGIEPVDEHEIRPFSLENPPKRLTILYVGRLEKRKGIRALLEAIPSVIERNPNVQFLIAGEDNSLHDGFQARSGTDYATSFARRHPELEGRVRFLGRVTDEELSRLYQKCDLFVAPSLYESFGLIYLEAMNYAKPVIGCRAGGIPEVVDDGVNGLLVEPGAAQPLADAITELISSPHKLRELGLAGRQRLLDRFTHLQMAKAFARIYRKTLQEWTT